MEIEESKPMEDACIAFGLYLNISDTAEAVSNALLNLFLLQEKPDNAVEFIRENLDPSVNLHFAKLKREIQSAEEELAQLDALVAECRAKSIKLIEEQAEALELDANIFGDVSETNAKDAEAVDGSAEINEQSSQANVEGAEIEAELKPSAENAEVKVESKAIEEATETA